MLINFGWDPFGGYEFEATKMKEKIRKIGLDIIPEAPWGTHLCQFYQTKEDLIDVLVPYFKTGLENNEFCMWVTSEPLKVEEAKAALKKTVRNLDKYIKKGQIEILDYSQWYTKTGKFEADKVLEGWVKKEKEALKKGFDGLRLTGNTLWLEKKDWKNFTDYEAAVNSVIGNYRMIAICTYCLDKCRASEVIDAVNNHQLAIIRRKGKWELLESAEHKKAEEQIKTRLAYEKTLIKISNEALINPKLDSFINFSLKKLGELTDLSRTYIFKIYDNGKKTSNTHEWVAQGIMPQIDNLQNMDCNTVPFWMKKLRKNEIMNFSDVKNFPSPEREMLQEQGIKSILVVPMYGRKGLYGFMGFDKCKEHRKWETNDAELLRTASQIITQAIERKGAEEKIRVLSDAVENAYDPIVVTNLDGKVEYLNKAAERTYGYKKSELLGKKVAVLDVDPKRAKEILLGALKGGWSGEILCRTKSGKRFPVLLSASPIKNEDGETIAVMGASKDLAEITKLKKEREVLTEKVVQLTKHVPLTEKEKLVFYGLVRWPELNDLQLSKRLGVKRPTVTAIKNKLKRQGFYSTHIIPDFGLLGCELMSVVLGESSPAMQGEKKLKSGSGNEIAECPEIVYAISTDREFINLLVLKNFTEFKKINDGLRARKPEPEKSISIAHFPFETTRVHPLFDYSQVLDTLLGLNLKKKEKELELVEPETPRPLKLTEREATILYALTKYPDLNDSAIAKKVKTVRQTVSKTRRRLFSHGIIKLINKPNIKKMGFDLFAAEYKKFNSSANPKEIKKARNEMKRVCPAILMISSNVDEFCLGVFKDYLGYKVEQNRMNQFFKEKKLLEAEPKPVIMPVKQIKFYKMDFAPLVKKILNLTIDF